MDASSITLFIVNFKTKGQRLELEAWVGVMCLTFFYGRIVHQFRARALRVLVRVC